MAYNTIQKLLLAVGAAMAFTACYPGSTSVVPDYKAENVIGIPLSKNSKLQSSTDEDSDKVVIFDKTIRKIHHFDLASSKHLGLFEVEQPEEDHYLIYNSGSDYFIDMSRRHVSIQKLNGQRNNTSVKFVGTPISASYDGKQGYLVVYDSQQSVLIFKIDATGKLVKQFVSGPVVDTLGTIQAGDIAGNGKLVLSIRGNSDPTTGTVTDYIVAVDIERTIADSNTQKALVFDTADKTAMTLTEMSWVAPVPGSPNLVMIRSSGKISLMDLTTKAISSLPTDDWVVEKYSKIKDPHIIFRKNYDFYATVNGNVERRMFYVDGGGLKTKVQTKNFNYILNSHLDIKKDQWNVTKANVVKEYDLYNAYNNDFFQGRSFTRIRLNDLLSVIDTPIDDKATVEIAGDFIFSLFPSDMGKATTTDIESSRTKTITNFNIKYMK
tara:strand:+ start:63650 stop:64960 length:1311 start_codon:yes stop_codon:yes gene_type:complete